MSFLIRIEESKQSEISSLTASKSRTGSRESLAQA
jgi:hypothetical protein